MKIAIVAGDDLTQNPRVRWEARALAAAGHRVTVHGVLSPATEEEEDEAGVVYVRAPLKGWQATGGGLKNPVRLARWYDRFRPVVELAAGRELPEAIHAHDLDVAGPAQETAQRLGVPLIYDVCGAAYVDRLSALAPSDISPAKRSVYESAIRHLRRRGTALEKRLRKQGLAATVVDTASLADDLVRRYGGKRPIVVRSCPPYRKVQRGPALRRKLGVYPTERVILFLGAPTEGCGLDAAIRAMKLLGDGYVLVVLGRIPRLTKYERLAEEEGVSGRVRFTSPPPDEELVRLVASADVAVVPTEPSTPVNRMGIPARLFMAIAAGLPVVASDTTEVAAIVRRTGAGVLYPARSPQDPAALAEGVHLLLNDGSLAATCAEAAARAAREELNWEKESLALVDLYDRIEQER
jgi:glycogen(starch) synthase